MKKFAIRIIASGIILFLVFASCFFSSCSSRKLNKQKELVEVQKQSSSDSLFESAAKVDSTSQAKVNSTEEKKSSENSMEEFQEEALELELAPSDSLEVINYDANGKKTGSKKYKGSGKIKDSKTNKKTNTSTTTAIKKKTDSVAKTELSKRNATKARLAKANSEKAKLEKAQLDRETKGFSVSTYLFLIIAIIVFFILVYLNKRFKWFGWIVNHVRKLFTAKDTLA